MNLFERIQSTKSRELSAATDRLNEAITRVETALIDLRLNVQGAFNCGVTPWASLCFRKHEGAWGLYLETTSGVVRAVKASRADRMMVADNLESLVERLLSNCDEELGEVEVRVKRLNELADTLAAAATSRP